MGVQHATSPRPGELQPAIEPKLASLLFRSIMGMVPTSEFYTGAEVRIQPPQRGTFEIQLGLLQPFGEPRPIKVTLDTDTKGLTINGQPIGKVNDVMLAQLAPYLSKAERGEVVNARWEGDLPVRGLSKGQASTTPPSNETLDVGQKRDLENARDLVREKISIALALDLGLDLEHAARSDFGGVTGDVNRTLSNGLAKRHSRLTARDSSSVTVYDVDDSDLLHVKVRHANGHVALDRVFAIPHLESLIARHASEVSQHMDKGAVRERRHSPTLIVPVRFDQAAYAATVTAMSISEIVAEYLDIDSQMKAQASERGLDAGKLGLEALTGMSDVFNPAKSGGNKLSSLIAAGMSMFAINAVVSPDLIKKAQIVSEQIAQRFEAIVTEATEQNPKIVCDTAVSILRKAAEAAKGLKKIKLMGGAYLIKGTLAKDANYAANFIKSCVKGTPEPMQVTTKVMIACALMNPTSKPKDNPEA